MCDSAWGNLRVKPNVGYTQPIINDIEPNLFLFLALRLVEGLSGTITVSIGFSSFTIMLPSRMILLNREEFVFIT